MAVTARLDDAYPGRIVLESSYEDKEGITAMLSRKWSAKDKIWHCPLAWSTCLQLRYTFGDNLVIDKSLGDWAYAHKTDVIDPALALRESLTLDDVETWNHVTKQAHELGEELELFPHQPTGAAFMATVRECGIFDETGTGKSAQGVTALRAMHRAGNTDVFPVLIVAPNSVKTTWKRELQKWWPGLTVHVIEGSPAARRKIFETPGHVYICNYEQTYRHSRLARYGNMELKRCTECGGIDEKVTPAKCEVHQREFNQIDFQTVICDEAHRMLHPSKQTRAIWSVSDQAKYRFALTGTPIQDNIDDFWYILRYLSPDEYPSKVRYIDRYADVGYNNWGIMQINGIKADKEAEFRAVTQLKTRRMLKKIVLPFLPPIVNERRYIEMTPPQNKAYKQMVKEALAELDGTEEVIAAASPLSKATRLLQFASAYGEFVDDAGNVVGTPAATAASEAAEEADEEMGDPRFKMALPSNKIAQFMGDIESGDFGDSAVVVFAQSRQLIDMLSSEMTKKKIEHGLITGGQGTAERQQHIDDFQAGKFKFILVTIQAGGVGLTLTAADTMVFLQRSYSSTAMTQAKSRAHRIGSQIHETITIIDYISERTIEEKQLDALEGKAGRIEMVLQDKDLLRKFLDTAVEVLDEVAAVS